MNELFRRLRTESVGSSPTQPGMLPVNRLSLSIKVCRLLSDVSSLGSDPKRKLELMLRISSSGSREILSGRVPQRPREVRERTVRFGRAARVVKKESMEKL